jgi:hypothetical protein
MLGQDYGQQAAIYAAQALARVRCLRTDQLLAAAQMCECLKAQRTTVRGFGQDVELSMDVVPGACQPAVAIPKADPCKLMYKPDCATGKPLFTVARPTTAVEPAPTTPTAPEPTAPSEAGMAMPTRGWMIGGALALAVVGIVIWQLKRKKD